MSKIDLKEYLPPFIYDYDEVKAVVKAENPEFNFLFKSYEQEKNNQFVLTTDITGIARWEKLLGIIPLPSDDLETRQYKVLAKMSSTQLPYTYKQLQRRLTELCGENGFLMQLFNERYFLHIRIFVSNESKFWAVDEFVRNMLPCNILLDLAVLRTWGDVFENNTNWGEVYEKYSSWGEVYGYLEE